MGTLYLHIGTPKTGTSMIQRFLGRNCEILREKGYSFPDFGISFEGIGKNRNAYFMTCKVFDVEKNRDLAEEKRIRDKGYEKLLQELDSCENVILSDEHIWNGYPAIDRFWEELNERISRFGHRLKVIVYLRRQDKFIQSYWAQKVKEYIRMPFDRYIDEECYKGCQLEYHKVLEDISNKIGREKITVRVYEQEQYMGKNHSLISDFLHAVGLELTSEYDNSLESVNAGLKGGCLEVKRYLNALPEYRKGKSFIVPYLYEVAQEEEEADDYKALACFAEGQLEKFMNKFEAGNCEIAKKYMNKESGILFEEKIDYSYQEKQEYTKKEMILTCGKMLLAMQEHITELEEENKRCREKMNDYKKTSLRFFGNKIKSRVKGGIKKVLNLIQKVSGAKKLSMAMKMN